MQHAPAQIHEIRDAVALKSRLEQGAVTADIVHHDHDIRGTHFTAHQELPDLGGDIFRFECHITRLADCHRSAFRKGLLVQRVDISAQMRKRPLLESVLLRQKDLLRFHAE